MSHMDTSASGGSPFGSAPERSKRLVSTIARDGSRAFDAVRAASIRTAGQVGERWPAVRERIPARTLALGLLGVVTVAMFAVGVDRLIERNSAQTATAVQSSPSIEIQNLSNGREGRPFALAGGRPLFPLPATSLSAFADSPVEMQQVAVADVVPSKGFWAGIADAPHEQVFVQMRPARNGESEALEMPEVSAGDIVNLSGYVRETQLSAETMGIGDPVRIGQFESQGYLVEANSVRPQQQASANQ